MDGTILTPDQRLRVFVSSTLDELAPERQAAQRAVEQLHLSPVLFELGARPYPPRSLYLAYLRQSHVFVGIYWERYGWIAPEMEISGLEDELREASGMPRLLYVREPSPGRDPRLAAMIDQLVSTDISYKRFTDADQLERVIADDLAILLTEKVAAAAEPTRSPALATSLPVPASTFVGRTADIAALSDLLSHDGARLVTLTGPGGVGKTRLATHMARLLADQFEDGAVFVPLSGAAPDGLLSNIASTLGLKDRGGQPLDAVVSAYFADREMLLVLDSFEHLLSCGAQLRCLVEAAPRVRVLVTSRAALRIHGEQEFVVDPLALPTAAATEMARVSASEAVQLFANRVGVVRRGFTVDRDNAATVAEICRRLDGLPLALELVAARANVLSLDELLAKLGGVLDISARAPDIDERHRTLRKTMDWSFDQLTPDAQQAFAQLSVFAGPFTAEAAAAVVDQPADLLDLLGDLVDHSLLRADLSASRARFSMLDMVREYARSKLAADDADDADGAADRHAAYFHDVAVAADDALRGTSQSKTLAELDGEIADIEAALDWLFRRQRRDEMADITWSLWLYFWLRGMLTSARRWTHAALDTDGPLSPRSRARLLAADSFTAMWQRDSDELVLAQLTEAERLGRAEQDDAAVSLCQLALVVIFGAMGEDDRAYESAQEAIALARRHDDAWTESYLRTAMCWLSAAMGRFDRDDFEEALAGTRAIDDELAIAMALGNLGELRAYQGRTVEAAELLSESLRLCLDLSMVYVGAGIVDTASGLLAKVGDDTRSVELAGAAVAAMESIKAQLMPNRMARLEQRVRDARRRLGPAAVQRAWETGAAWTFEQAAGEAQRALGAVSGGDAAASGRVAS